MTADPTDPEHQNGPGRSGGPGHPDGTVLTVAPTGAHTKETVPQVPVSAEEVAATAVDCERIGAAVLDLQPRRDTVFAEIVVAVRARTNLGVRIAALPRSESLTGLFSAGPDALSCPLDAPGEFIDELRHRAQKQGIAVHYEARSLPQLATFMDQVRKNQTHVVLVFDEHGMCGDVQTFATALAALPTVTTFTATGIEQTSLPILLATLSSGGHVRVGMADTVHYAEKTEVRDNTQLVARAAGIAKIAQRPPLPPARAAEILGFNPRLRKVTRS